MRKILFISLGVTLALLTCSSTKKEPKRKERQKVLVETIYGNMIIELYDETPLHRNNFIKLVENGFYDSLLFHRVINKFMIQGGDPESKNAEAGKILGEGGPGYDIDAEFVPSIYHKKGALAAAREGDNLNPEKKSSGSQFYIVQGNLIDSIQLSQIEDKINFPKMRDLVFNYIENPENIALKTKIDSIKSSGDRRAVNQAYTEVSNTLKTEYEKLDLFRYSDKQREAYTSIGGTPMLDQGYTVFGQVIDGIQVIDSIAVVRTDQHDRPITDVIMKMSLI